jgi:hypothetical protein
MEGSEELKRLGSFRKKCRGRLLPLLLRRLSKPHAWSATVLIDEVDAGGLQGGSKRGSDFGSERLGSFRKKWGHRSSSLLLWRLSKPDALTSTILGDELNADGLQGSSALALREAANRSVSARCGTELVAAEPVEAMVAVLLNLRSLSLGERRRNEATLSASGVMGFPVIPLLF